MQGECLDKDRGSRGWGPINTHHTAKKTIPVLKTAVCLFTVSQGKMSLPK